MINCVMKAKRKVKNPNKCLLFCNWVKIFSTERVIFRELCNFWLLSKTLRAVEVCVTLDRKCRNLCNSSSSNSVFNLKALKKAACLEAKEMIV